jgi:hypothetical protein
MLRLVLQALPKLAHQRRATDGNDCKTSAVSVGMSGIHRCASCTPGVRVSTRLRARWRSVAKPYAVSYEQISFPNRASAGQAEANWSGLCRTCASSSQQGMTMVRRCGGCYGMSMATAVLVPKLPNGSRAIAICVRRQRAPSARGVDDHQRASQHEHQRRAGAQHGRFRGC